MSYPAIGQVPEIRVRRANSHAVCPHGQYVLYWMIAQRRPKWNFALDRAVDWAKALGKPLVIFEALRCGYPWASDRLHRFVLDGMVANAQAFSKTCATYYPYVEQRAGAGRGLLETLARDACAVITDDYPCFFLPQMVAAAAARISVLCEAIDSNGLLPLRAADRVYLRAYDFRRFLQRTLGKHLAHLPRANPLARVVLPELAALPGDILRRWPAATTALLAGDANELAKLPIDHRVGVVPTRGGCAVATSALDRFLNDVLPHYEQERNQPEKDGTSGLSPYLHFGHLSAHEVLHRLGQREHWSAEALGESAPRTGDGWWRMSKPAEGFLDQLVTWRELGFNFCWQRADYDQYESLPAWAQATLARHASDRRSHVYTLDEFAGSRTHDPLWNAAQRQLVREGRIHNYLRMLWGKKILEWSPTPRDALAVMIELNNRYALDGRDPNSYSGIFWVLGRYDRAWGPERPIFGTIRYMSSASTARKLRVKGYLARYQDWADSERER